MNVPILTPAEKKEMEDFSKIDSKDMYLTDLSDLKKKLK